MKPSFKPTLYASLIAVAVCHAHPAHAQTGPGDAGAPQGQLGAATADPPTLAAHSASAGLAARVHLWNGAALRADALDHTPLSGSPRVNGDQFGPARSSRALALIHLAMFEAVNAVARAYPSYTGMGAAPSDTSADAALSRAAHDALAALYPSQATRFGQLYAREMALLAPGRARDNGVETGRRAAAALLALHGSGSGYRDRVVGVNFFPSNAPGKWRPDPVNRSNLALGADWDGVRPFVLATPGALRPAAPPALTSSAYAAAFNEVRQLGGDGVTTPTRRTALQTVIGIYWAYDTAPYVGTVPRLYNQIAAVIAGRRGLGGLDTARMFALVNVAMADACLVVWKTKYHDEFWRPATGIREASPGASPTGLGDGNPATQGEPHWTPLGAPASNRMAPNFTPPFPAYPSGHAGLGSAAFQVLRRFYGTDRIAFTFVSDEYNGITRDNRGKVRPRLPRSFGTLSQAEEENGQSRIYLGVHWAFDKTAGIEVGRRVGDYVYEHGLVRPAD